MKTSLMAEKILKLLNGGRIRTGQDQVTPEQVMVAIQIERDKAVADWIEVNGETGKPPPDDMFTAHPDADWTWDATRLEWWLEIPYGAMQLREDRGIRLMPSEAGFNPFRRVASGMSGTVPVMASLGQDRIPWSVQASPSGGLKRVVVPAGHTPPRTRLETVVSDSRAIPGGDAGIPDRLVADVEEAVLRKYRIYSRVADKANDRRAQA